MANQKRNIVTIPRLSVVMLTCNRREKTRQALESIRWADEIIILDGASTDGTLQLCKHYTDKIFPQPDHNTLQSYGNIDLIKNEGFKKTTEEWILSLDSDEIVPAELAAEIQSTIASSPDQCGFFIPRKNYYWGRHVRCLDPDYQLRLFKKGTAQFCGDHLHEKINVTGPVTYLNNYLIHNAYDSTADFLKRSRRYWPNEINFLKQNREKKSIPAILTLLPRKLYYYYVRQKAYRDGLTGLIVSLLYSIYYFIPYLVFFITSKNQNTTYDQTIN